MQLTSKTIPFRPLPLFSGPHTQTIIASTLYAPLGPPSETRRVLMPDGDQLALEVSTPPGWQSNEPTVLMIHGLSGCHRSPYLVRMARKLYRRGLRAVRMNMRGCGSGRGLARLPYHSGRSEDAMAAIKFLRDETPESPITLIGFSLGGNVSLKLAGELGADASEHLHQVIAICPPADLSVCSKMISHPQNRLYNWRFVKLLKIDIDFRHSHFSDLPRPSLPKHLTLYELDDLYTAPQSGFQDAEDYYQKCSSAPLVPKITIPCRILFSRDDPFIDCTVFEDKILPDNIEVFRVNHGGHLGFLGMPGTPGGYRWMDYQLIKWLGNA